jgi:hypothetical protein
LRAILGQAATGEDLLMTKGTLKVKFTSQDPVAGSAEASTPTYLFNAEAGMKAGTRLPSTR